VGQLRRVRVHPSDEVRHNAIALFEQSHQQMFGLDLRIVGLGRKLDGGCDGFAGLLGVLVDVHDARSSF
jgi:hypothetical protein